MNIPITISIKGNSNALNEQLFGRKILDKKTGKHEHLKSTEIDEGITMMSTGRAHIVDPVEVFSDYYYFIEIAKTAFALGGQAYIIGEWLWYKMRFLDFRLQVGNKEVESKDELQKTLDDYIKTQNKV